MDILKKEAPQCHGAAKAIRRKAFGCVHHNEYYDTWSVVDDVNVLYLYWPGQANRCDYVRTTEFMCMGGELYEP